MPEADRIVVNGKTVVRLHISPLPVKPTSVQGRYYVRKAKSNHLMSVAELSDMYLKATSSSWDAFPSEHPMEDISLEKVAAFAKRMNPDNPDDPMRLLRKLSLVKDGKPNNACYLAFVKDYCSRTAFQTGRFKTRSHIIDDKTFNSDILAQLDGVMEFVMKHLMAELVITGKPQHDIKYDYPVDAIREIVLNMIVHRDYRNTSIVNTIKIFDDHMEFTNAGGLPAGLTMSDILSDNYISSPRNPRLAELFKDAGLIEKYGSGIKRIMDACKMHGGVTASFEDHGTWFKVIVTKVDIGMPQAAPYVATDGSLKALQKALQKTLQKMPQKTPQKILAAIRENPFVGTQEMADKIGVERSTVARAIAKLKREGTLRRIGPDKGGHWEVIEKND